MKEVVPGPHFKKEISNVEHLLIKNIYLSYLIDNQVKLFLNNKFSTKTCNAVKEIKNFLFDKFP